MTTWLLKIDYTDKGRHWSTRRKTLLNPVRCAANWISETSRDFIYVHSDLELGKIIISPGLAIIFECSEFSKQVNGSGFLVKKTCFLVPWMGLCVLSTFKLKSAKMLGSRWPFGSTPDKDLGPSCRQVMHLGVPPANHSKKAQSKKNTAGFFLLSKLQLVRLVRMLWTIKEWQ